MYAYLHLHLRYLGHATGIVSLGEEKHQQHFSLFVLDLSPILMQVELIGMGGQGMSGTITEEITHAKSIILISIEDPKVAHLISGTIPQTGGLESLALVNYPISGTLPLFTEQRFLGLAVQEVSFGSSELVGSFISGSLPNADTVPLVQALSINK